MGVHLCIRTGTVRYKLLLTTPYRLTYKRLIGRTRAQEILSNRDILITWLQLRPQDRHQCLSVDTSLAVNTTEGTRSAGAGIGQFPGEVYTQPHHTFCFEIRREHPSK